jgi:hypothetical protein
MTRIFAILLVFLISCNNKKENKYTAILQSADSVGIAFKFEDRISEVRKTEKGVFENINKVLSGKEEKCSCTTSGYMLVYSKDSVALDIDFATAEGGGGKKCQFLMIKEGTDTVCYRLTYNMGMYLDELRNFIKPN